MEQDKLIKTIATQLEKVPYGSISLTIHRHSGKTTGLVMNEYENKLFQDNLEFMDFLIAGLKTVAEKKQSGDITLKIQITEGRFKKLTEERKIIES